LPPHVEGGKTALWVSLIALLGATGCFNAGVPVRTADMPRSGQPSFHLDMTVVTYAPGRFASSAGDVQGNSGQRAKLHPIAWLALHAINTVGSFHIGVTDGFSIGAIFGVQQLGGELRLGLADQDDGDPFSVSAAAGAAYRPFIQAEGGWYETGLDISRRFGDWALLLNLYLSYGPEAHAFGPPEALDCESTSTEGCELTEYGPPPYLTATRDELRLHVALGGGPTGRDYSTRHAVYLALVGYATAYAAAPHRLECVGCSYLELTDFRESYGLSLVLGFSLWDES
jgi:hypothetical protein